MKFEKREGFALLTVLFVMIILSIFFISIMTITQSNTKQIIVQEDNLRAYYLARSGIDIAYAAIMKEEKGVIKISDFINDTNDIIKHENLALPEEKNAFGFVDIEVTKNVEEVKISAKARTKNGPGRSSLSLFIDKIDYTKTRWVKE